MLALNRFLLTFAVRFVSPEETYVYYTGDALSLYWKPAFRKQARDARKCSILGALRLFCVKKCSTNWQNKTTHSIFTKLLVLSPSSKDLGFGGLRTLNPRYKTKRYNDKEKNEIDHGGGPFLGLQNSANCSNLLKT